MLMHAVFFSKFRIGFIELDCEHKHSHRGYNRQLYCTIRIKMRIYELI